MFINSLDHVICDPENLNWSEMGLPSSVEPLSSVDFVLSGTKLSYQCGSDKIGISASGRVLMFGSIVCR